MEYYFFSLFFGFSFISTLGLIIRLVLGSHKYVSAVLENDFFYNNQTENVEIWSNGNNYISKDVNQDVLTSKKAA